LNSPLKDEAEFMNRIALVDDDSNLLVSLSKTFRSEGYGIETFTNGAEALSALCQNPVDLVVLDINMPIMDGKEMLTRLRKNSDVPVIFLTSRDEQEDEMEGLRLGADDYIRKPFSQGLLLLRVQSILKRSGQSSDRATEISTEQNTMERGSLLLDMDRHDCCWKGESIHLTVTEFQILQSLAHYPGHIKTRDHLMNVAYGEHIHVADRNIDYHIKRIRNKFKAVDPAFDMIETRHGRGYALRNDKS